jgi:hypothetical protein
MMSIEIGVLATVISVCIGIASYFGGRQASSKQDGKQDGERWGRFEGKLDRMDGVMTDVKDSIDKLDKRTTESLRDLSRRLDEHIRIAHSGNGPKYEASS